MNFILQNTLPIYLQIVWVLTASICGFYIGRNYITYSDNITRDLMILFFTFFFIGRLVNFLYVL